MDDYEINYHYFQITIDPSVMRLGEQVPKDGYLDQPITLRQLKQAFEEASPPPGRTFNNTFFRTVEALLRPPETDYIAVNFGNSMRRYVYKVASQPARRVQVGDLVTIAPNMLSSQHQVVRVMEINVPKPATGGDTVAVAIAPDDAAKIEARLGKAQ